MIDQMKEEESLRLSTVLNSLTTDPSGPVMFCDVFGTIHPTVCGSALVSNKKKKVLDKMMHTQNNEAKKKPAAAVLKKKTTTVPLSLSEESRIKLKKVDDMWADYVTDLRTVFVKRDLPEDSAEKVIQGLVLCRDNLGIPESRIMLTIASNMEEAKKKRLVDCCVSAGINVRVGLHAGLD